MFGALLFAVPLIIHLLSRHRHKRRPWAAMEFLLNAYKKQRKRLRRENLLLLLLRCLIPILLALAIARPLLKSDSGLAGGSGATHYVLVFDHSYSMDLELPGRASPFEKAKSIAGRLVDRLKANSGHKVTIMLSGVRPTIKLQGEMNLKRAKAVLASLSPPVDSSREITAALQQAAELTAKPSEAAWAVCLFTDLQTRSFGEDPFAVEDKADGLSPNTPPGNAPTPNPSATGKPGGSTDSPTDAMFADSARDAIASIRETGEFSLFDVLSQRGDGGREDNLQITDIYLGIAHAIAKVATPVVVKVQNRTETAQTIQVTLEVDSAQPTRRSIEVEAGGEGEAEFLISFHELGQRTLRASIEGDSLRADNDRWRIVEVRKQLRLLVVEGSDSDDPALRDSTQFVDAIDPTHGEGPPELTVFQPKVVNWMTLYSQKEPLKEYDMIVLCNVERIGERAGRALRDAMNGGTGLFIIFGDRCDVEDYNIHLYGTGDGPMPMLLNGAEGYLPGGDSHYASTITTPEHPVFADLHDEAHRALFEDLPIFKFMASEPMARPENEAKQNPGTTDPEKDGASRLNQVLARVRDSGQNPLLIASEYGTARSLFLMSSVDRRPERWNLMGDLMGIIFMPFVHPTSYWLTLPVHDNYNVQVGQPLYAVLDHRPFNMAVVTPDRSGLGKVPVAEVARPLRGDRYALPAFTKTDHGGIYRGEMLLDISGGSQPEKLLFAVNPDPEEGDLVYLTHASARDQLDIKQIYTQLPASGNTALEAGINDLGPLLLLLVLLFVLSESTLARWISRRRS